MLNKRQSSDESVKEGYFWANIDSTWTILDQKRLVSMDYLYHRSLEFHNNHHTFRATGDYDYTKGVGFAEDNDLVCEVLEFRNDRLPGLPLRLHSIEYIPYLSRLKLPEEGLIWFNIKDLRALAPLGELLQLHAVTLSHFYDLRAHSTVNSVESGLFSSFLTVTLYGDDAEMHKIYTYCGSRYVITFERELIAEPEDTPINEISVKSADLSRENKQSVVSALTNPSGIFSIDKTKSNPNSTGFEKHLKSDLYPLNITLDSDNDFRNSFQSADKVFPAPPNASNIPTVPHPHHHHHHHHNEMCVMSNLFQRMDQEMYKRVCQLGSFYLLYEIGTETLAISDSLIEFLSRTIFHLKQQVHRRITYRQKLHFHRKISILVANVNMLVTVVDEIRVNMKQLLNKTSAEFDIFLQQMTWEHIVYMSCLIDSYEFKATCLQRQLHDVHSMEIAMGHVTAVRNEKTSVDLALVATVFLPLTFFAGVFGMNFQEDGGYTMELLNWKYGPEIFWAMCFLVILVNMYFFYTTGLLTWKENEGILSTDGPRWMSRESETSEDFEEGSIDYRKESLLDGHSIASAVDERSIQEEFRRVSEAKSRRTIDARRYVKDQHRTYPLQSY